MTKALQILSYGSITSSLVCDDYQSSFEQTFIDDAVLDAILADHFQMQLRRAGRFAKYVALAASQCLRKVPANFMRDKRVGLFLGTSLGNTPDTYRFSRDALRPEAKQLSPTAFVNSSNNAALYFIYGMFSHIGPANIITQETLSFESTLLSAQISLLAGEIDVALLGTADVLMQPLENQRTRMSLAHVPLSRLGEGSSFFLLSTRPFPEVRAIGRFADLSMDALQFPPCADAYYAFGVDMADHGMNAPKPFGRYLDYHAYCGVYPTNASYAVCKFLNDKHDSPGETFLYTNRKVSETGNRRLSYILVDT